MRVHSWDCSQTPVMFMMRHWLPEVWSRDTTAPWTPLVLNSRADHLQAVVPHFPVSQRHSTCVSCRQHQRRNWRHHEAESAFQLINGGRCSSDSLQHDRGSCFPGCCCPRMEQPTVIRYDIVITVDFQTPFEDKFVRNILLMMLTQLSTSLLFAEHVDYCNFVTCPWSLF